MLRTTECKESHANDIFKDFFTHSNVGLAVVDEGFRFRCVNDTLASINGIRALDHQGQKVRDIVGPAIAFRVERAMRHVLTSRKAVLNVHLAGPLVFKPHAGRWLGNYFPLHGESQHIGAVIIPLENNAEFPAADRQGPGQVLRSWKEIGQYTGACVKTVQRWEWSHGFPVRRISPGKGSVVFALVHEVDEWFRTRGITH